MRKKHFAGVLMLTAAVSLGTVSPVVLPNTAIEVKAAINNLTGTYTNTVIGNTTVGDGEVLVITNANLTNEIGTNHFYGFGKTKDEAIKAALQAIKDDNHKVTVSGNKFTTEKVPDDAKSLVILKKAENLDSASSADGTEIEFSSKREDAPKKNTDYTYIDGEAQVTALENKKLQYRVKGEKDWKDGNKVTGVAGGTKFPATAVEGGNVAEYEVRTQAEAGKLPSVPADLKIISKRKITKEDLQKHLSFKVVNTDLVVAGTEYFSNNIATLSGLIAHQVSVDGSVNNLTPISNNKIALVKDKKIVIAANGGEDDAKLTLTVKEMVKPTIKKVENEYQLELTNPTANTDVKYEVAGADNQFKPVEFKKSGEKMIADVAGADTYKVRAVSTKNAADGTVKFDDKYEAAYILSKESDAETIAAIQGKIDTAKFNKIALAVAGGKLTITNHADLAQVKDEVVYNYGGADVKLDLTKTDPISLELKAGKFVLKTKDSKFSKTINFVDPIDKKSFESGAQLLAALGGKDKLGEFTVKDSKDKEVKEADYAKLAYGDYTVKFKAPSNALTPDVAEQTYKLSTEVKVTIRKVSYTSPVVPSTTPTPEPKKDEPKKNEPKKEEPKKNEPKKEEPKKDDAKKDDSKDMASSTDDTKPAPAKKATAKTAKVSVKVTSKEVTNKLQTSGTKLVAKNVYKVTVKNASKPVSTSIKVNLGKKAKTVYVLDLKTGKTIKALYKKGKVTFKTKNSIAKFVIVNKAAKAKKK